jgi:taurine dioxygenase
LLSIEPSGEILGATVRGIDLSTPLSDADFGQILLAIGHFGVVHFPEQVLAPEEQKSFTARFGGLHQNASHRWPGVPEISILSNIVEDGRNIGYVDAGMIWHRDVVYQKVPAFATVLHALKVPRRDGVALGDTKFINTQAATDDLPGDVLTRLKGVVGIHDSGVYNERVRAAGSKRPSYAKMPYKHEPMPHPILWHHPITGKVALYCDPGNVNRIDGLTEDEASEMLAFLFDHQLQEKYRYSFNWTEGDVLMWDNFGTLHRANPDYGLDEHRLAQRSQAMADKVLDPGFVKLALAQVPVTA